MDRLPTIDEALALVLARARPLASEPVSLADAHRRVLGAVAVSLVDLPPFRSSAMDGYAVRVADTPGRLRIAGQAAAGHPFGAGVGPGEAAAISTGAVVPAGADAVVPVEVVEVTGGEVLVPAAAAGAHVRPAGGDVRAGDVVLAAGSRLGPSQLGALAASGLAAVECARRPDVAVLATGSELRAPGEPLGPGQIYESNSVLLSAQIADAGGTARRLPRVADDAHATRDALAEALDGADVVVTSGGVSVGEHDLVRGALAELGAREVFWRVAVRPGKPVAFSVRGDTLVFGLPGNPVSALVGFELFVRPALLALQGVPDPGPPWLPAALGATVRRNDGRDNLVRARTRIDAGRVVVDPLSGQESHMIGRSAVADALVLIPRGSGELAAGEPVTYLRV